MLNQPPNYPITLRIDNTDVPAKLWPCIPRIGESVEANEGSRYKIVDIVHTFTHPNAQITLVLEKPD
jgi:hypothetical protein